MMPAMAQPVTPRELAARLGVSDKRLRGWLRAQAASGHELLRTHQHQANWLFTADEANTLAAEFRRGSGSSAAGPGTGCSDALIGATLAPANGAPEPVPATAAAEADHVMSVTTAPDADTDQVAGMLTATPVPAGGMQPSAIPSEPGLYAWWAAADAVPGLTYGLEGARHPTAAADLDLLYVGISQDLRGRLARKHLASSTGGSTLRRALAALLGPQLGLIACWSPNGDRVTLEKDSEARLTAWMRNALHVSWVPHPIPKAVERDVIELLGPPCNVDHNAHHPNYPRMVAARSAWRRSVDAPGAQSDPSTPERETDRGTPSAE